MNLINPPRPIAQLFSFGIAQRAAEHPVLTLNIIQEMERRFVFFFKLNEQTKITKKKKKRNDGFFQAPPPLVSLFFSFFLARNWISP